MEQVQLDHLITQAIDVLKAVRPLWESMHNHLFFVRNLLISVSSTFFDASFRAMRHRLEIYKWVIFLELIL